MNKETKEVQENQGVCPECGEELGYEETPDMKEGNSVGYECYCIDEECGYKGIEWYTLTFSNFTKTN